MNMGVQSILFGEPVELRAMLKFHIAYGIMTLILRVFQINILKRYRRLGGNYRNIYLIGETIDIDALEKKFSNQKDLGYKVVNRFSFSEYEPKTFSKKLIEDEIDEIFIASEEQIKTENANFLIAAENNLVKIRIVPAFSNVYSSNLAVDYIGFQPILVYRDTPLDDYVHKTVKRIFDIIFSLLIIIGILSWLVPIIAILIRLESKGPIFFKQARSGLKNKTFNCYKFRSMHVNDNADKLQVRKGDSRITKVGAFIRKTSIDELPQFFNVFLGNMSVVGPRPHMVRHTEEFSLIVDNYMVRHAVKPGITGLAQITGYRGETSTDWDIKGRVKMDIFYIDNWNFFLDLRIIFLTIYNAVRGEEKAY